MASPCNCEEYNKIAEHPRAKRWTIVRPYVKPNGALAIHVIGYVTSLQRRILGPYTVAICDQGNDPNGKGWALYLGNNPDVGTDPVSLAAKGATIGGVTLDGSPFSIGQTCHSNGWTMINS